MKPQTLHKLHVTYAYLKWWYKTDFLDNFG